MSNNKSRKAQSKKAVKRTATGLSAQQKRDLARIKKTGLAKITGAEKPATLKRKISTAKKQFAAEMDTHKSFFFGVPKNKMGEALKEKAKAIGLITTDKGFFYERGFREGSEGELKITKTGKATLIIKEPKTERSRARTIAIPIETVEELERHQEHIRRAVDKLGPLKKGEHLTFRVTERNREGLSLRHFQNADQIFRWISHYEKARSRNLNTEAKRNLWRNYFYRHVDVVKMTDAEHNQKLKQIRELREKRHKQYLKQKADKRKQQYNKAFRAGAMAERKRLRKRRR